MGIDTKNEQPASGCRLKTAASGSACWCEKPTGSSMWACATGHPRDTAMGSAMGPEIKHDLSMSKLARVILKMRLAKYAKS
jgi:hypothetical protein